MGAGAVFDPGFDRDMAGKLIEDVLDGQPVRNRLRRRAAQFKIVIARQLEFIVDPHALPQSPPEADDMYPRNRAQLPDASAFDRQEVVGVPGIALVGERNQVREYFTGIFVKEFGPPRCVDREAHERILQHRSGCGVGHLQRRTLSVPQPQDPEATRRQRFGGNLKLDPQRRNLSGQVDRRVIGLKPPFHRTDRRTAPVRRRDR